jgi:hypothetical protein
MMLQLLLLQVLLLLLLVIVVLLPVLLRVPLRVAVFSGFCVASKPGAVRVLCWLCSIADATSMASQAVLHTQQ